MSTHAWSGVGEISNVLLWSFPSRKIYSSCSDQWKFPFSTCKYSSGAIDFHTYILYYSLPLSDSERLLESRSPGISFKSIVSCDRIKVELTGSY